MDKFNDAPAVAEFVAEERERLRRDFLAQPSGCAHSLALTQLLDAAVRRLFVLAARETEAAIPHTGVELAILATGGYGRRDVCPQSDIDITFVAAEEEDPYLDAVVRRLFFLIMDVFTGRLGMKVGYAFRVPAECADLDPQTRTALLDCRWLAGNERLVQRFRTELQRTMQPAAYLYGRCAEREERRLQQGGVVYRAEPDVKEGVGALRDLHFVEWIARAEARRPLEDPWAYLVASGDLEPSARERAVEAREFLLLVRHALHYACSRRFDTLSRARQDDVAAMIGYPDSCALMADFYRHAEAVDAIAVRVLAKIRQMPLPLRDGLVVQDGEIGMEEPRSWSDLPAILSVFRLSQEYGMPLQFDLGEQLAECAARLPVENPPAAGRLLLKILGASAGIERTLRQMVRWGVLQRLIPEFGEAMRLAPPAPLHEFTVGEHTLRVIGVLEEAREAPPRDQSDYAAVFADVQHKETLFLAALLHDLGKRTDPGRHSEVGAPEARAIALRLGMDAADADEVAFLVRRHLLMSDTARLRDLTQERSIRDFTAVVDNPERLNQLLLFTYADLRATGGGVWTPVQERFLEDLYYRALRALSTPEEEDDLATRVKRQRRRMQRELTLQHLPAEAVQEHFNTMPPAYLLNNPVDVIAMHIRLVERLKVEGTVVEFQDEPGRDFTTITLCTYDDPRPGLLSKIAAAFYAHNLNVHAAQVFTRDGEPGVALDTLWVDSDGRRLRSFERVELERDLQDVLAGRITAESLLSRRGKPPEPDFSEADVRVNNEVSETHTVLEVRITDCRGLLYRLTNRLSELGWDIHSARVNTFGGVVRDAFYVTDHQGEKLMEEASQIRAKLLQ